jgi:hypothetical protein
MAFRILLRRTSGGLIICISWLMQGGHDPWRVSDFTATSMDTILKVYGHHHPDHQSEIADSFGRRPQNVRVMR